MLVSLLIDTNIVLDVILARKPWAHDAVLLLDEVAQGNAIGFIASHSITTVYYIVEKRLNRAAANTAVSDLLSVLKVVSLDTADFSRALSMGLRDYEDAVQAAACLKAGCDFVVTRNAPDFKGASVETRAPGEVLALVALRPPQRLPRTGVAS